MRKPITFLMICLMGAAPAATVTLDPGNGVATNVTARFTGATDIVINSGTTGGGIVTLANPLSTYTGKTTVNSGTLVVPDGDVAKGRSSIGASGPIVLGAGTLRASGTLGAVVTNEYPAKSTLATVLDVQDELHVTNDFVQKAGVFIKTGPGTVYFSGARNCFGGEQNMAGANLAQTDTLVFNANGDAPTTGRRGAFMVAEGTMVVEGGYNVFGNDTCYNSVGTWTVDEGTEKSAVLEIRGGTNIFNKCIWPGFMNGYAGTTGGEGVRSGLRVTGGVVSNGTATSESVMMGGNQNAPSGNTFDTYPFIEMTGGYMYIGKNLQLAYKGGAHSTVSISGTAELDVAPTAPAQYIGFGDQGGPSKGWLTVSENGTLRAPFIEMRSKAGDSTWDITLKDGATVNTKYIGHIAKLNTGTVNINLLGGTLTTTGATPFKPNSGSAKVNVLLDGGTFVNGFTGEQPLTNFISTLASVRVGTRGFTFAGAKSTNQNRKDGYFQTSIVYTNTHPGEARQPIDFKGPDGSRYSYYTLAKNCTIDAPVRVWAYGFLLLDEGSDVVGGNPLMLGNAARLRLKGGAHTVDTLSLGFEGSTDGYSTLMIASNSTITATREVLHPGTSYLNIYFYNENLGDISAGAIPGAYTLIAAPEASRAVLEELVETAKLVNASGDKITSYRFQTVVEGGQAKLQLVVLANSAASSLAQGAWSNGTGDGLWKTDGNWEGGASVNSATTEAVFSKDAAAGGETVTLAGQAAAGGIAFSGANGYTVTGGELLLGGLATISSVTPETNTIASALTATAQVNVNPAGTGGGVVRLTGDLSGLAGGLSVNSGTLEANDLSFATDASKLVLGAGTFAYTGAEAAEIPGLSLASVAPAGAVLRVDSPLALRSAEALGKTLFVKTGAETLRLKGNGSFALTGATGPTTAWSGEEIYVGASGDGPTRGMYGATVREGRLEIGTVGDDADAPNVTAFSLAAGGQPLEGRAPAEIVMNNGTVTLEGAIKVDGYVGGTATNKLVVNGGLLSARNEINVGLASRSAEGLASAVVELNGGILESREKNVVMYQNGSEMELFLNAGGALKSVGIAGGSASAPAGTAHFDGGAYKPFNNGNNVIYLWYIRHAYVGAGGFVIDTSEQGTANTAPCYLNVTQTFEKEPALGDAPDGGVRIFGGGMVYLSPAFSMEGLSGGVTVEDGTTLIANMSTGGEGTTVRVNAGATLRTYQSGDNPMFADSLVLGEAGATKAARFEVRSSSGTSLHNCTVSNDFQVLGPVQFATRTSWNATALANTVTGVYTMFVYRASCDANVDVDKFALDPEMSPLVADFEKVDVTLDDEGGWKALVATVRAAEAGELPRWTATSAGGNWSESANWNGFAAPNGVNDVATFAPAEAAAVPVALDAPATVKQALFEAMSAGNGYVLGGANALTFARDDDDALLDVGTGGKVTVNVPVASGAMLCVNAAQDAATRGTAGEVVFGAGALDGFAGTLYPRSGTVTVPSLAWMTNASQLRLGFGTVKYTGTGETIPGFQLWPSSKYMATLEIENDLTVSGSVAMGNNGCFHKAGEGTLTLTGTGTYSLGNNHNQDYYWGTPSTAGQPENTRCANGDSPVNATVNLSVGTGKLVIGEPGGAAGPRVYTSAYAAIGLPSSGDADAEMEVNGGTFTVQKHDLYVGYYHGLDKPVKAKLTVNGGAVDVREQVVMEYGQASTCSPEIEVNGGTLDVGDSVCMSVGKANRSAALASESTSTFTVNGGTVTVQTNFYVVYRNEDSERANHGRLYLNGGELDVKGTLNVTRNSHARTTAQAWLNPGGLLKAGTLAATRAGGAFYFNGGVFAPYGVLPNGTATSLEASNLPLYVSTNGAVISTANANGGSYAVPAALLHDPALAGKDGGLVKTGSGVLTLSGANTYTGPTVVDAGTLAVLSGVPFTDDTIVRAGALLDLGGETRTLANLTGDGTVFGSVTLAGALTPQNGVPTIDGDFATAATACVDFGCTGGDMVEYGSEYAVLRVTGTVAPDIKFKAVNCGQPCTLGVTVEDGFVFVHAKSGGTLLLFR